jgi:glutathione S-transferase
MEGRARELLSMLDSLVPSPPTRWIFGEKPTALDAHLVVFIARMRDVGRRNLIPERLEKYGDWAMEGKEWMKMMNGRATMIPAK